MITTADKVKLINHKDIKGVLFDVVKVIEEDIGESPPEGGDLERLQYVNRLIARVKSQYKKEMSVSSLKEQQRDLENLIISIKSGEEPKWINKKV